ncbi:glucosamine--fructose-6-phosphate aminotransferase (isomerizing) [Solimonas aquatica]|uniref:Glutamine--fructose-6-phosphate aminotransferase [isomerizing] n=1 Tax=Solimonas aquatica TaxID=489703 RepID=A0A1H9JAN4_9GAMM|nr:glutamine--fructose-6-phosphate transaminase (isomerizing) [Solimonas aquatica]SEQ83848.1 glucosamine--fructose-6-phosphate aminotransferase (isomerizing) [Solimonas aquatica]
MCGIVGAIAQTDVTPLLIEGLRRLEYRGYDSTGIALSDGHGGLALRRAVGKVTRLQDKLASAPCAGVLGVAHSRWATHGGVTEANAHPHVSGGRIALIHNGIIENYVELKAELSAQGYVFASETDTEVVAHLIHAEVTKGLDLTAAVQQAVRRLKGAYAIVVFDAQQPDRICVARIASPLVIGLGENANYVASDVQALLPVTRRFHFLEEGDVADVRREGVTIYDAQGRRVQRKLHESSLSADAVERGEFAHYMLKEIYEQPRAIADTLSERIVGDHVLQAAFGPMAAEILPAVQSVHIVACGTSYHAGLVARYYLEQGTRIPCTVEVASEYRYRDPVVLPGTLFLAISQSGETADTLAALREAKRLGYLATGAICNVPESSLVREADLVLMTRAGPEVGVASTKAFTTQLAALGLLGLAIAQAQLQDRRRIALFARQMLQVPEMVEHTLKLDGQIREWAKHFADKHHALFLGRGPSYPIALEGALKLKEISYIHAEAYPAGELKHGPLALVDDDMPVIAVAPNNALLEKLKSNLQEVRARGGKLFVFADPNTGLEEADGVEVITMPEHIEALQAPLVYTIPLQLLAYHVAVLKGTDVDQPRNLAKSVTVE